MKTKLITLQKLSDRGNPPKCAVKLVMDFIAVTYWGKILEGLCTQTALQEPTFLFHAKSAKARNHR